MIGGMTAGGNGRSQLCAGDWSGCAVTARGWGWVPVHRNSGVCWIL